VSTPRQSDDVRLDSAPEHILGPVEDAAAVETEQESLDSSRSALDALLPTRDGPHIVASNPDDVQSRLDELARGRQRVVQRRYAGSRADCHDLCQYLYGEFDWTYPVLTAVTRFRDGMV
jgi:hypothetical protein